MFERQIGMVTLKVPADWEELKAIYLYHPNEAIPQAIHFLQRNDLSLLDRARAHGLISWMYGTYFKRGDDEGVHHGEFAVALTDTLSAEPLSLLESAQVWSLSIACHNDLALCLGLQGRYREAVMMYDKALERIEQSGITCHRAGILCDKAGALYYEGDLDAAVREASLALALVSGDEEASFPKVLGHNWLGLVAMARFDFESAARHFQQATALLHEDHRYQSADKLLVLHSLAMLAIYQGRVDEARQYGQALLDLSGPTHESAGMALGQAVIAWVRHQEGQRLAAQSLVAEAYQMAVDSKRHWLGIEIGRIIARIS